MRRTMLFAVCCMMVMGGMVFVGARTAEAGSKVVPVEGALYSVKDAMYENIARFKGKYIKALLPGGQQITGKVVDVNGGLLHLSELEREEFLDALINVDDIVAVKAVFRKYQ